MTASATFTLAMEIGFPFLIWVPALRWIMLTMAVMLHTGIAVFMGLNTFSLLMFCMLLAFIPGQAINTVLDAIGNGARRFRLAFDARVPAQVRAASLARAADVWDQVDYVENSGARRARADRAVPTTLTNGECAFEVSADHGGPLRGASACAYLLRNLRLIRPIGWLLYVPGLAWLLGLSALDRSGHHASVRGNGKGVRVPGEKITQ
jgi:hypothetical protein